MTLKARLWVTQESLEIDRSHTNFHWHSTAIMVLSWIISKKLNVEHCVPLKFVLEVTQPVNRRTVCRRHHITDIYRRAAMFVLLIAW